MKKYIFLALIGFGLRAYSQMPPVNANQTSNMVKQLFFAGLREKMSENFNVASTTFNKVIALDGRNHAAYYELASLNLRQNKLPEAELNIKKAIELNAGNKWYLRLLTEVYKRTNNMAELISVFNQLITLEPDNDIYYFDKANAQLISNQTNAAKKTYDEIEAKFGTSRDLTNARRRVDGGNATESDIIKLLEGNQADVKNYLYAAGLLLQKNNDAEALKVLLKAQQIEPKNFEVNLGLADIYRKQKNDEAAFASLKLAFESEEMPIDEKVKIVAALFSKIEEPIVAKKHYCI